MRYVLISDIHGCFRQFDELLDKTGYGPNDQLILIGDLFDRGPDSYKVYAEVRSLMRSMETKPVLVRGNHEQMMIASCLDVSGKLGKRWSNRILWMSNGGGETESSFQAERANINVAARFIKDNTVFYYETEQFIAVHGDPRDLKSPHTCMWDTWSVYHNDYRGKLVIVGHTPLPTPVYCDGSGDEESKELPYGEWLDLPEIGLITIDTGGVFGGTFTAAVIDEQKIRFDKVKGLK